MSDYFSTQRTAELAVPQTKLTPPQGGLGGKKVKTGLFTVPTGNVATAKTIEMVQVPAGAMFLGGKIKAEAMSTAGGDAGCTIGDGTTADRFKGSTSVDAAAEFEFGHTVALGYGTVFSAPTTIVLTTNGEAWAAAKKVYAEVNFVMT